MERQERANAFRDKVNNISQKHKSFQIKTERQASGEYIAKVSDRMSIIHTTGLNDLEQEAIDAAKNWIDQNR